MHARDPLNPDLYEIIAYAQEKSGKSMFEFLVYIGDLSKSDYVDFIHKHEQEMMEKAKRRL